MSKKKKNRKDSEIETVEGEVIEFDEPKENFFMKTKNTIGNCREKIADGFNRNKPKIKRVLITSGLVIGAYLAGKHGAEANSSNASFHESDPEIIPELAEGEIENDSTTDESTVSDTVEPEIEVYNF